MDLDQYLNSKQKEAATYLASNLRIVAGAGSGKTRVLTYRIAYLIENVGIEPYRILAITFTNKAANEMKERVINILGDYASGATLCTIHSLCVRILRRNINALGYPSNFIIIDEEDQKSLLKKLCKEKEIDNKTITTKSLIQYISSQKNNRISPSVAYEFAGDFTADQQKAVIYEAYETYNQEHFMLDFDDLLLKTLELFEEYPDILEYWQRRYQYIHVDEFQDVGRIDYNLIQYLSEKAILCVVGDPDQTIYSFRGSDVNFIMNFDSDYDNVKTIILDRNYRSTQAILDVSNHLIKNNHNRVDKDLYTLEDVGDKIHHYSAVDEESEARYVIDTIEEMIHNGCVESDFAILYRANYLSRTFEQKLIQRHINYKIFGGLKFFNRKEVKDALSYIRLMVNGDDLSFERIVNVPSRGVGAKTLERIQLKAIEYGMNDYEALCTFSQEINLSAKAKKALVNFASSIEKAKKSTLPLPEVFEQLMNDVGYMAMLKKDNDENRIANIMELKNSIATYMETHEDSATFENYLQDIALYTSQDEINNHDYVSLMSIHMAKGLEFNYVFVVGCSQEIFPSPRSLMEAGEDGMEEERRLAYVAFTRAKKGLFITENTGYSYVNQSLKTGSQFIKELGDEHVEHVGKKPDTYDTIVSKKDHQYTVIHDDKELRVGELVMHDVFGKGVVVKKQGNTVDVAFSMPYGIKTLMSSHPALKKIIN
ncbi:MAG: ATP-dependent helicase [Erysipelotrichaceae bacterium]|nr:ATP-dependent helicase [Erysipelotrichaceae bacterium]